MCRTKSGYTCQIWNSQSPHRHSLQNRNIKKLESHGKRAGCTKDCMRCIYNIKWTEKMKQYTPERDDSARQQEKEVFFDMPNSSGLKEMEPREQFMAQVDQCEDC